METYFSTLHNVGQTEQFQFAGLKNSQIFSLIPQFETTMQTKKPESIGVSLHDPNGANFKNTAISNEPIASNEMLWYSAETFKSKL